MANLVALPIGIVAAVVVAVLWLAVTPLQDVTPTMSLPAFLVSFAGIVVVHELIHAAVHPMSGRSLHSIVGFWPSGGMFYAHYDGEMTRNRFVAILLMPLVVISFVPVLVAAVAQVTCGWVAFISAFNAFLACADILGAGLVLFQIPATAIVRQQGWRTYWRESMRHWPANRRWSQCREGRQAQGGFERQLRRSCHGSAICYAHDPP
jgi:hypothetical protein